MFKPKRGRKPKYTHVITLNNINAKELQKRLKGEPQKIQSNNNTAPAIISYGSGEVISETNIEDIISNNVDSSKNCWLTEDSMTVLMKDHVDYGCLPNRTDLCCWHDSHTFSTSPIGIPIKYIPKKPDTKTHEGQGKNDYFLTMGVFCSFPCCLAYINEHPTEHLLRNSRSLLYLLYYKLYSTEMKANPAPSWKHLKEYGGVTTIDDFRKSFCSNYNYIITNNIKRPFMVAVGNYIEEKRCC